MFSFKNWLKESYGTSGGLEPPLQAPGGLSSDDMRKGRGSAMGVSMNPELDKDPPKGKGSPTSKSSKYVKEREDDILKYLKKEGYGMQGLKSFAVYYRTDEETPWQFKFYARSVSEKRLKATLRWKRGWPPEQVRCQEQMPGYPPTADK